MQNILKNFGPITTENLEAIIKAVTTTGSYGASGLMPTKVAETFLEEVIDDSSYLGKVRNEPTLSLTGSQPKIGVGKRMLRAHVEGQDEISSNMQVPILGTVPYANKYMVAGTGISEEWIEQNLQKENFEKLFLGMIGKQVKADVLDLAFNGDEQASSSLLDYQFLRINDGFIKQVRNGGHVVDNKGINDGVFNEKVFKNLKLAVPSKKRNVNFKWHVSDTTYEELVDILTERNTSLGDNMLLNGDNIKVKGHYFEVIPNFPDDVILFADPKNFMITWFLNIINGKTKEGVEALFKRMRYYATFLACDFVVQDLDATSILINRGVAKQHPILTKSDNSISGSVGGVSDGQ